MQKPDRLDGLGHASRFISARRYSGEYFIDDDTASCSIRACSTWPTTSAKGANLARLRRKRLRHVTPSAGMRWDDYPRDGASVPDRLVSEHVWNAGIEVGVRPTSALRLMGGYTYERSKLDMSAVVRDAAGAAPGNVCNFPGYIAFTPYTAPGACGWSDNLTTTYHTFITSADWKAIPGKLDFRANYVDILVARGA